MVERGFELSEASNTPVMMELRIRACHVRGSFKSKNNVAPAVSTRHKLDGPPKEFIYDRLAHPPATFRQEKLKSDVRLPAARKFILENQLNEVFPGAENVGIVVQGGLYNGLMRALRTLGLADAFGASRIPILALNVVYPLVPEEIIGFAKNKKAVLVLEEGQPEFIEQEIATFLRRAPTLPSQSCTARTSCTWRASTTSRRWCAASRSSSASMRRTWRSRAGSAWMKSVQENEGKSRRIARRAAGAAADVLRRLPGAPGVLGDEAGRARHRPAARLDGRGLPRLRQLRAVLAGQHAARLRHEPRRRRRREPDVVEARRWRSWATAASGTTACSPGVASNLLNKGDGVLVIMKNGYASATGTQELLSSPPEDARMIAVGESAAGADRTIENTLTGLGVKWLRTVNNYDVGAMAKTYREAMTTPEKGLKVIVAEGECQLERQRRLKPQVAKNLADGKSDACA